ncbi:MAG TPA: RDD family protein [Thermoanaerobaculia bacterium]|nr:RDD family protein [Thermoanaerobaculia bacterium]HUM30603.1 RDD family protein [Thermoanaerobaculia bacterium]HXK68869.1 RDD family protein [Thermoanaerobaculia bacterium]
MATIRFSIPGENRLEDLNLDREEISIGRVEGNAVVLKDEGVSRLHARIRLTPRGFAVIDNGSANGTWVNGKRVEEALLKDGDEIMIGKTVILFSDREDPGATVRFNVAKVMNDVSKIKAKQTVPVASRPTTPARPSLRKTASVNPGKIVPPLRSIESRHYAGFWIRLVAYVIDSIVLSILCGLVMIPAAFLTFTTREDLTATILIIVGTGTLCSILSVGYLVVFWAKSGATLGKKMLGLKIVRDDSDTPLGYGKAFLRLLGYMLSNVILYAGFIMVAFTRRKQGLHDYVAGTVVIRTR